MAKSTLKGKDLQKEIDRKVTWLVFLYWSCRELRCMQFVCKFSGFAPTVVSDSIKQLREAFRSKKGRFINEIRWSNNDTCFIHGVRTPKEFISWLTK